MNVSMAEVLELVGLAPPEREIGHIFCPFHDEATPSCAIWDGDDPHWHCFGCGAGGGPVDFVARFLGGSRWKAVETIRKGVADVDDRPEREVVKRELLDLGEDFISRQRDAWPSSGQEAANFVQEKWPHLGLFQLESWGVGVGRYNLLIPHRDHEGVIRGIKTRSFTGGSKGQKGAVAGSCFTTRLYRVGHENPEAYTAILVEGESDTWTMSKHYASADEVQVYGLPSGAACWKPEFKAELFKHSWSVVLFLDSDEAGQAASRTIAADLAGRTVYAGHVPLGKDVTEAYLEGWRPQW